MLYKLRTLLTVVLFSHLLLTASNIFSSAPRIVITISPKCDFNATDLQKSFACNIVSGKREEMKEQILRLDKSQPCHSVVLNDPVIDIYFFSREIGYAPLNLDENLEKSLKKINDTIAKIPTSEADFTIIKPEVAGRLYDLVMKVNVIFKKNNFSYWASCGTVLGTVRHQGLIPWDDDVDFAFFSKDIPRLNELKNALSEAGLELYYFAEREFFKIYFKDGNPIPKNKLQTYPWKFPFLDLFPVVESGDKYVYTWKEYQEKYANQYYLKDDLKFPLKEMSFGPTKIPVAANPIDYLNRSYGSDWNDIAYAEYSHENEYNVRKVKVELTKRIQIPYILPK